MNTTGKILTAFAVGATVGVALGILFAPEKGSVTRQKINDQGKKFADSFNEKFRKAKDDLKEELRKAQESVNDFEEA